MVALRVPAWVSVLLVALASGALGACSGTSDGSAGGGDGGADASGTGGAGLGTPPPALPTTPPPDLTDVPAIPEDEAGAALGDLCEVWVGCECDSAAPVTVADCEAYFATLTEGAIEEAQDVTYDGDCVAQTVAAFTYLGCVTESQALAHFEVLLAAAQLGDCKMYHGSQAAGDTCTLLTSSNGDDCAADLECVDGTCQPRPSLLTEGAACTDQEDCEAGLVCLIDAVGSDTKSCQELPAEGEACLFGLICEPGAYCASEGDCAALPAAGDACATTADVFDRVCQPEATCSGGTCAPLPLGGEDCAGEACAPGFICRNGSCEPEAAAICAGGPFPLFPGTG